MTALQYQIEVVTVGRMDEVPTPSIFRLEGNGRYEPFCYTVCILRQGDRTILINTGFPEDVTAIAKAWRDEDERLDFIRTEEMRLPAILAARGIDPDSVEAVFLTPIGPYNTGNISLFRNARIFISRRGWAHQMGLDDGLPRAQRNIAIPDAELAHLVTEGFERLTLLDDEAVPLPGIRTFHVGVHHPGSIAIAIETASGTAIFSDAFFKFGNIEAMKPIGYCQDLRECLRSYKRIAAEADLLIPMYDPDLFLRYPGGVVG
jgi:glyoxylase-like metal-dependent hydrolase (beta-lactamase superfamily II)